MSANDHKRKPIASVNEEVDQSPADQVREAFGIGIKKIVTPRDGDKTVLVIRQFYADQLFDVIDKVEKVWSMAKSLADDKGNVDMFTLFKSVKEEAMELVATAIDQDRKTFVGKLELDDLIDIFVTLFTINKDFFEQRVRARIQEVVGLISSIS